jgi:prevent-host-death family protein
LDEAKSDTNGIMRVNVTEASKSLAELVTIAEAGGEVIITDHGRAIVQLVPIRSAPDRNGRRAVLEAVRRDGAAVAIAGPSAARSQDFLYS